MKLAASFTVDEENSVRAQLRYAVHWLAIAASACRPRDPTRARLENAAERVQAAQQALDLKRDPETIRGVLERGDFSASPKQAAAYIDNVCRTCELSIARVAA
jgi:hypothetical protein